MQFDRFNGAIRRFGVVAVSATLAVTTIGLPASTVSAAPERAPSISPATDPVTAISVVKQVSVDSGATWHDADSPTGPTVTSGFLGVKFRFQISNVGGTALENITLTDSDVTIPAASVPTTLAVGGVSNWIGAGPFPAQSGQHANIATVFATEEGAAPAELPPDDPNFDYEYLFVFENGTVAAGKWDDGNNMNLSVNHPDIVLSDFVHVSCSDTFGFDDGDPSNDGWSSKGQAPDPVDDPNWRLAGYAIRKSNVCGGGDTTTGVTDTDMAHYVGVDVPPSIDIEKDVKVNDGAWFDADDPTGPTAIVDVDDVSFRFTVTNTGGADLTDLDVFEIANTNYTFTFPDALIAANDPLLIGQSFSFELGPFPAAAGQHMNNVKVTANTVAAPAFDPLALHRERNFKYVFRFVLADGTVIEGSSKDNAAKVPATDSETETRVTPNQTFLQDFHVSCSDDFGFGNSEPDGWGEKGSPEINTTDNGPIVSYKIIKYKSDNPTNSDFTTIDSQCGFGDPSPGPVMVMDTDKAHYLGQVLPAMLGDYVWLDSGGGDLALAGNGIQDPGEQPVEGVVVRLLDGNGIDTGRSTTTDVNGFYKFDDLVPNQNYRVKFERPTGTVFTVANEGGDDAKDSDAHINTGQTANVSMAPNEFNQSVDAGLFACPAAAQPAQIVVNLAGTRLLDSGPTMTPEFVVDVPAGTYKITLVSADFGAGHTAQNQKFEQFFARLTDAVGNTYDSAVISDIPDSDIEPNWLLEQVNAEGNLLVVSNDATSLKGVHVAVNIGDQPTANSVDPICVILEPVPVSAVGDFVWLDSDGDGIQDQGEAGVNGVTVELLDGDMNLLDTTVTANAPGTDAPGYYLFDQLPHGTYFIRFVKPDGYEFTLQDVGNDDFDSDANPVDPDQGTTAAIVLAPGDSDLTIDAGLVQPAIQIVKCVRPDPASVLGSAACGDGNGVDANDANGADVPVFSSGDAIVWTYLVKNTGSQAFDGANVIVTDDVLGTIAGPPAGDVGADNKLSPGETWTYTATGSAADLGNPPAGVPVVSGCADIPSDGDPARNVYMNVGSVVVPGASANDPAHYCNPAPTVDIEKTTNGADADGADDADVPVIAPGDQVTWTYTVTNTGVVSIPAANITVTDSDPTITPVLVTDTASADSILQPGEVWTYTATRAAADLYTANTGVHANAIVQGCTNIPDQSDPTRNTYRNIGTVTVPGDTDTDNSHYCNPAPSVDIEKATNGLDADGVNDGVPNIAPGADIIWTYLVTNTGVVSIPVGDITVTDSVAGVTPILDPTSDVGSDGVLSPGEIWTYTAAGTASTLSGEDINADHIVLGCANNPINTAPARNTYENIGTVTIPGDTDTDPSHYCNPPTPGIDIEKLTNGNDADTADGVVPVVVPGAIVQWTYLVTNTGTLPYAAGDITVTDNVAGITPVRDVTTDTGSDNILSPGETWTYTATGTAADLGNPPAGTPVVQGCADIPSDGDPARNVYENIGSVTVPGGGDTDPSHYCNPAPTVDIEKTTNGADADGADDADVPVIAPGDQVTWTYTVTNTGVVSIPAANITVTDSDPTITPVLVTDTASADSILQPGEVWTYTATRAAADLYTANTGVHANAIVQGCTNIPDQSDPTRNTYRNIGTVTVPGDTDTDNSHYCNPAPSVDIEKATNGLDADGVNDGVPNIAPGADIIWTYLVTNTGVVSIPVGDITVTDSVAGVTPILDPTSDVGSDGVLSPGEIWTYTAAGTASTLSGEDINADHIVLGCANNPINTAPARNTYENIGTVTIPGDTDTDPSHYCNPPTPGIDIEKLTNGNDADTADGVVPVVVPGAIVQWTYLVTNTGTLPYAAGDITVTDNVAGITPVRDVTTDTGSDNILSPGETWTYTATGTAADLGNPPAGTPVVQGCADIPSDGDPARNVYENIGSVTVPGGGDTDPSHYCNPAPTVDIEKTTNGADADGADDADVPVIAPGDQVTWTYTVTNTGVVSIPAANITVTDSDPTITPVLVTDTASADSILQPGEVWTYTATRAAADLYAANTGVHANAIVQGCTNIPDQSDPTRNTYRNIGTVTVPGDTDTDNSHYCNLLGAIGDRVWLDANANGVQDDGELGIPNVLIRLLDSNMAIIATEGTDSDGNYLFDQLIQRTYFVQFVAPPNSMFSPQNVDDPPSSDALDSDPDPTTGVTDAIALASGETDLTWDAGVFFKASLGDFVWDDLNANGVQDDGEPGIEGLTVNLLDGDGNPTGQTDITDANGAYEFTGLTPGDYIVEFVAPDGAMFSPTGAGTPVTDSDASTDPATLGRTGTINLSSGETDLTWDAGVFFKASLGDFVWHDLNANGVQDDGEPGIPGVTVNLLDADGNPTGQSDITDANGAYGFDGLTPGDYIVEFVAPDAYQQSPVDQGGDDTTDSDAALDAVAGRTISINLESGENDPTWDAGYYQLASLGDFVWDDLNANGVQDDGEPGIPGVTVNLLDRDGNPTGQTDITDANGAYGFDGLIPGDYIVEFVPGDMNFTTPDVGDDDSDSDANPANGRAPVTLESGETDLTIDAGLVDTATLGDRVWDDLNANGLQDDGEPGIPGVTVNLLNAAGVEQDTTITDANGLYTFTNLEPGDYIVEFEIPAGYQQSPAGAGVVDAVDSDAGEVGATAPTRTVTINLQSGESDLTWDAGVYLPAAIGDFVWDDLDADGIQDDGEPGMPGVTVTLLDGNGDPVAGIDPIVTDDTGAYEFTGLTPGDYIVEFTPGGDEVFSDPNAGDDDTVDSNADPVTGQAPVTLESGETDNTIDAGLHNLAAIGDFVWDDLDADGIQDDGEPGMPGVTVTLLDGNGDPVAGIDPIVTDDTGAYEFTGLTPGDYIVEFTPGGDEVFSDPNAGDDDTVDSNADPVTGQAPVTLESGETDNTIDAGLHNLAAIGDFVWDDLDADGIQDDGEPGMPGVTVTLLDGNGDPVAGIDPIVTDDTGAYEFTGLTPGDYIVEFTPGGDEVFSDPNAGDDDTVDSNADPVTGQAPVTLESGETDNTIDAGLHNLAAIGDRVWYDEGNGTAGTALNGRQDLGEVGVGGVLVTLLDAELNIISTTLTDEAGFYEFTDLEPGTYSVVFDKPDNSEFTTAGQGDDIGDSDADTTTGATGPITLTSGQTDNTWDAGIYRLATIGDFVWDDLDADGIQDAGEPGLDNIVVNLLDGEVNVVDSTETNPDGSYEFTGVEPGEYIVEVVNPGGSTFSPANQGGNDNTDSDTNPAGQTAPFVVEPNDNQDQWDAGLVKPATIGDLVWYDEGSGIVANDRNGIQDVGEAGAAGVTVTLLDSQMNPITSTTTNASGEYEFTGLQPGTYYVQFDKPAGTDRTLANQGGNDAVDSDADPTTGKTGAIVLTSGESDDTVDAGLTRIPPPDPKADLAITKTASVETTAPGNTFNWILDIRNNGPDTAINVRVGDQVPADLTVTDVASTDFTCSNAGNTVSCTRASLASGGTGQVIISVQVKTSVQGGTIENIGTVQSDTPDPDLTNNSDDEDVDIVVQIPPTTQAPPPPVTLPPTGNSGTSGMVQTAIVMIVLGAGLVLLRRRLTVRPQG